MFDELSEKLEATFAKLRGRGVLTESDIKEGLREVRRVLLEADVNFQLTREFLERVEKKAVGAMPGVGSEPSASPVSPRATPGICPPGSDCSSRSRASPRRTLRSCSWTSPPAGWTRRRRNGSSAS